MKFDEVAQINLTPTLALAMGIPIPYSNLGVIVADIFQMNDFLAIMENLKQVNTQFSNIEKSCSI